MARPIGLSQKKKDNSNKSFRQHDDWRAGKKIGRAKQVWVWDGPKGFGGHWEKVA
jgi:hypothetical protein